MQQNNNNPLHYRDHTRQQDGWTVLVPPAGAPPPYTPEDNAPAASQAAANPVPAGPLLPFEIPINSNVVGATLVTRTKAYGRGVPFATAYAELCDLMALHPTTTSLGYKWDNERVSTATHGLSNATDWENCLESGIGQMERARTRTVICMIKNLNLPQETVSAGPSRGSKRKSAGGPSECEKRTFHYTKEYRELKNHLACALHRHQLCYVDTVDGHHHRVDREETTLWAKEIAVGNATLKRPPENIVFQEFFLPDRKKPRTTPRSHSANTQSAPAMPTIHVTVNTGTSSAAGTSGGNTVTVSPPRRSPLGTITAANANAANIAANIPTSLYRSQPHVLGGDENTIPDEIRYPPVTSILQGIDDSGLFEGSSTLTFPAVIFADYLREVGITRVDHVLVLDASFFVDQIHMPVELAELFVEESISAMGKDWKGKGRAN
ncbi:hypothetical protein C8F04DRAFT_1230450 [Mycena alexandri]|uniref:Uncharacterized protein n=1 Tax=Mycena alexandri TaxID=1745969 RepID=A0AAD6T8N5_9AGAR|nr:hypothetical protein C8F04DRAFT_1230450 [Mycena alexandri]